MLLTAPLTILAVQFALSFASPAFQPRLFVEADPLALVSYSIAAGLVTAIFEKLGWTDFALPSILERRGGVLASGLNVGLLYAAWNLPIINLAETGNTTPGTLPTALFLLAILFTWQPAYRVLLALVYDRTRSLGLGNADGGQPHCVLGRASITSWRTPGRPWLPSTSPSHSPGAASQQPSPS